MPTQVSNEAVPMMRKRLGFVLERMADDSIGNHTWRAYQRERDQLYNWLAEHDTAWIERNG
jgi:hypothetical protein